MYAEQAKGRNQKRTQSTSGLDEPHIDMAATAASGMMGNVSTSKASEKHRTQSQFYDGASANRSFVDKSQLIDHLNMTKNSNARPAPCMFT